MSHGANTEPSVFRAWRQRVTRTEWFLFAATLVLIVLSLAFPLTDGFLPHAELDGQQLEATDGGRYEPVFVFLGAMFFATELLLFPFAPGNTWAIVLKIFAFLGIWCTQLFALRFVEVGSFTRTVVEGDNWVLAAWLFAFASSAPLALALGIPWVRRLSRGGEHASPFA